MNYYLGIDGGPERITAALFDQKGNELACEISERLMLSSGTKIECDMDDLWRTCSETVQKLIKSTGTPPESITGIGITGDNEGLCAIDAAGLPIFPMINRKDQRAAEEAEAVNEKTPGIGKLIHRTMGKRISAGSTLILLKWLKQNNLRAYNQIRYVFSPKDWLRLCMTDKINTDLSDIGGTLLKFNNADIPAQLLTVLGVPEISGMIPDISLATDWIGTLTLPAAETMRLYPGIPVAVGASRDLSSLCGLGIDHVGGFNVLLNDECRILKLLDKKDCDAGKYQHFTASTTEEQVIEVLNIFDGMKTIDHMLRTILDKPDQAKADTMVAASTPGAGGVIFSPCPMNESLSGFFGINTDTTRSDMIRAVYESIAFNLKACYDAEHATGDIILNGGSALGSVLPQIIADVVGVNVICATDPHIAAKGAALCAAVACSDYKDLKDATLNSDHPRQIYEPHSDPRYEKNYAMAKILERNSIPLWQEYKNATSNH